MKAGTKFLLVVCLLWGTTVSAQLVKQGKITYERRTNLLKKFDDERMAAMFNEKNKIRIERFSLFFNDTASLFSYIVPDQEDKMSWATMKNTVAQDLKNDQKTVLMDFWGTPLLVVDSVSIRQWKITDKTRKIAGYECTRAIWQKDDTTRIYAWFTTDIVPTVGPETMTGLPGAILGLATEDGGVVYFATSVEVLVPTQEQITMQKKKSKEYTDEELYAELKSKLEGQPFGPRVLKEIFFWDN
jgi:GLPGLI family protein